MNKIYPSAREPEDLGRFFVERANAGDADGLAALYEPDAVLAGPGGQVLQGAQAIRSFYAGLLKTGQSSSLATSALPSAMATLR